MWGQVHNSVTLAALLPISAAILLSLRLSRNRRSLAADDVLRRALTIGAYVLALFGLVGLVAGMTGLLSLFALPLFAVLIFFAVHRFRRSERLGMLWVLSVAAERGIPLEVAARAYAAERGDEMGLRAARLARLLEQGTPLLNALEEARSALPPESRLAVALGGRTGALGSPLRRAIAAEEEFSDAIWPSVAQLGYALSAATIMAWILIFSFVKIYPTFERMFSEFNIELPHINLWMSATGDALAPLLPAMLLAVTLIAAVLCLAPIYLLGMFSASPQIIRRLESSAFWIALGGSLLALSVVVTTIGFIAYRSLGGVSTILSAPMALILALTYYLGAIGWEPPGVRRLLRGRHTAVILQALAEAARQRRPFAETLRMLGESYPKKSVGWKLHRAAAEVASGAAWQASLHRSGLLSAADGAVLTAAERVGNLPWALEEMSASNRRRTGYRLKSLVAAAYPLLVLTFGVVVMVVALATMIPLVQLIWKLT